MDGYIVTVLLEISFISSGKRIFTRAQLMLTNSRDAVRGQSRLPTILSTVPYVRYSFLLVRNSKFVFKTRHFSDIRLQKCRDLEIRVVGYSRSFKVVPFGRLCMVS